MKLTNMRTNKYGGLIDIQKRVCDISYKKKLSHIGSSLWAAQIADSIFLHKKEDEPFVLSAGHGALGYYCVLEAYTGKNAEDIFDHHGVHPDRCKECGIDVSTGSLGQGLPIAVGLALADRKRKVYCVISDGECFEGSIYEAMIMKRDLKLDNLEVHLAFNGTSAYRHLYYDDIPDIIKKQTVNWLIVPPQLPFMQGLQAHYHVLDKGDLELLKANL